MLGAELTLHHDEDGYRIQRVWGVHRDETRGFQTQGRAINAMMAEAYRLAASQNTVIVRTGRRTLLIEELNQ